MVSVRHDQPLNYDGSVNLALWTDRLLQERPTLNRALLLDVCEQSWLAEQQTPARNNIWPTDHSSFRTGLAMADILVDLGLDEESLVAAIIYRAVREDKLKLAWVRERYGDTVAQLIDGVLRMAIISRLNTRQETVLNQGQNQLEQVRNMLASLIDDVRVALIKIAERACALRAMHHRSPEKRRLLAQEVFSIYAPLAHRLGVGQLKWELEDLSFSYIDPEAYRKIASLLDEKRILREKYIEKIISSLQDTFADHGIAAEVYGRAKHIYSIWKKMQSKNLAFSQIHDVHAVRILVSNESDCYGVLGEVHGLWKHLPDELDDYINRPKENGYRSLHTAVLGPEDKIVEVQIRSRTMHDDAEFGVCSHWRYKSGRDREDTSSVYEEKINWLRQVLERQEEMGDAPEAGMSLLGDISKNRIYVHTPEGHVVDLLAQSTPLDFAYRVHTDIGHRCRAAKVNNQIVPLNQPLQTGDRVQILTGEKADPRREWLHDHLGYLKSSSARIKVQNWLRQQSRDTLLRDGRRLIEEQFAYVVEKTPEFQELAACFDLDGEEALFLAVGKGELPPADLVLKWQERQNLQYQSRAEAIDETDELAIRISGAPTMQLVFSDCCKPTPDCKPFGIVGEENLVTVHREDCVELWQTGTVGKRIKLNWRSSDISTFTVELRVEAFDRPGLLMDVSGVVAKEKLNMSSVHTSEGSGNRMVIRLGLQVPDFGAVLRVLERLEMIPNVVQAKKLNPPAATETRSRK